MYVLVLEMATNLNDEVLVATSSFGTLVPGSATTHHLNRSDKPEKFNELNFKKWQKKMMFYLTTLGPVRFLNKDPPFKKEVERDKNFLIAHDS